MGDSTPAITVAGFAGDGDVDGLCRLLEKGLKVNSSDDECLSALHVAYVLGHRDFLCKLLHAGLNLDSVVIQELPFSETIHLQCLPCVLFYKVYQEAVELHGKLFKTLLQAVYMKDFNAVFELLEKGQSLKNLDKKTSSGNQCFSTLLFLLAYYDDCPEKLFQDIVNNMADVDIVFHGYPVCAFATLCGNDKCLKILLDNGCSSDELVSGVFSPFHYAIQLSHEGCLSLLLRQRCLSEFKVWREDGTCLLEFAVKHWQVQCVLLLFRHGVRAERTQHTSSTDSALMLAVKHRDSSMVEILLQNGADVNWTNDSLETPLIHAALLGCNDCLKLLIHYGAKVNALDSYKESALMHALQRGNTSCVQSLLSAGACVSFVSVERQTALCHAAALPDSACLELLLTSEQCRLDTLSLNDFHKEAFLFCLRQFNIGYLIVLLEHGVFNWSWLSDCDQLSTEILVKAVISACVSPGCFVLKEGKTTTLLQQAFEKEDLRTVNYLIANLYLAENDIKYLKTVEYLLPRIRGKLHELIFKLVNCVKSQPLLLQTMCLVKVSASLSPSSSRGRKRRDLVDTLPIPDKFKAVLKFECAISSVCVNFWHTIGDRGECERSSTNTLMAPWKSSWAKVDQCFDRPNCCDNPRTYMRRLALGRSRALALVLV